MLRLIEDGKPENCYRLFPIKTIHMDHFRNVTKMVYKYVEWCFGEWIHPGVQLAGRLPVRSRQGASAWPSWNPTKTRKPSPPSMWTADLTLVVSFETNFGTGCILFVLQFDGQFSYRLIDIVISSRTSSDKSFKAPKFSFCSFCSSFS